MQGPHDRDRHHPPGLSRAGLLALLALLLAAPAEAARFTPLPSPDAALSPQPPLGLSTVSREGVRHRVDATTRVDVTVDATGAPFAVAATQRLDVRVPGDYLLTVGAPVEHVEAAPGSASTPGFRSGAIVWAGFNPSRRLLAARATLAPRAVARVLPLRLVVSAGRTTLVNATRVTVGAFRANAVPHSLSKSLAAGALPAGALVTGTPTAVRVAVAAPLRVTGTIGARHVSLLLRQDSVVPSTGPVDLRVTPVAPAVPARLPASGTALFVLATRLSLETARARQYERFLANPDLQGRSETTFVYRTGRRPVIAAPAVVVTRTGRSWVETLLIVAAVLAVLYAALVVWARS